MFAADSHGGARFAAEARHRLRMQQRTGQQKLQSHALVELQMFRGDDDAHSPLTENALDAILPRKDLAFLHFEVHAEDRRGCV
jgi:hypothetical protein